MYTCAFVDNTRLVEDINRGHTNVQERRGTLYIGYTLYSIPCIRGYTCLHRE